MSASKSSVYVHSWVLEGVTNRLVSLAQRRPPSVSPIWIDSPAFSRSGKWKLGVRLQRSEKVADHWMFGVFLFLVKTGNRTVSMTGETATIDTLCVRYKFEITSARHEQRQLLNHFAAGGSGWGLPQLCKLHELADPACGWIDRDDRLTVTVEIDDAPSDSSWQWARSGLWTAMLNDTTHTDLLLISADGHEIPVHRAVLSKASAPLAAMVSQGFIEKSGGLVTMPETSASVIRAGLEYIYVGSTELATKLNSWEEAIALFEFAQMYHNHHPSPSLILPPSNSHPHTPTRKLPPC